MGLTATEQRSTHAIRSSKDMSQIQEEEKKRKEVDTDPVLNDRWLEDIFSSVPEKLIQIFILASSVFLCYKQYGAVDDDDFSIFKNEARVAGMLLSFLLRKCNDRDANTLPQFEIVYLLFLPFMTSFLFKKELTIFNSILALNALDIPLYEKIPMQALFIGFSAESDAELWEYGYGMLLNFSICQTLMKIGQLKSLDVIDCNLFSIVLTNVLYMIDPELPSLSFQILRGSLIAFFVTVAINYIISSLLTKMKKNPHIKSLSLFSIFVIVFPILMDQLIQLESIDERPSMWLLQYVLGSSARKSILLVWLSFLLILIPNVLIFKSNFSLNTSRKIWHFLILLLITMPFQMDPLFVKIALSGTIVLFLSVEYLRFLQLEPFGAYIDSKLRSFADFRDDKGPIIISYIYLIIGISTPLLINDSPVGLISLGVGDSLASIIGGKWGRYHWPGTRKTIEGTLSFIIGTSIVAYILKYYMEYFADITFSNLLWVCTISGILEGNSELNDNILIPTYMMILEKLLSN